MDKFSYFDQNTHWMKLTVIPLILGILSALASPYVSLLGAMWAEWPTNDRRIRAAKAANKISILNNRLREERNRTVASIIKSGKLDAEISDIADPQIQESVREQVKEARKFESGSLLLSGDANEQDSEKGPSIKEKIEILTEQAQLGNKRGDFKHENDVQNQLKTLVFQL